MLSDIRYAVRMMDRNRWFMAVVIGVLALGVGANTAIFSVVESVILRPLPFPDPGRLAFVWETSLKSSTRIGPSVEFSSISRNRTMSFDDMAALELGSGTVHRVRAAASTCRTCQHELSVRAGHPSGARSYFQSGEAWNDRLVIISYGFWQRNLGGAPDVIGRRLMVDDLPYVIIGVTPRRSGRRCHRVARAMERGGPARAVAPATISASSVGCGMVRRRARSGAHRDRGTHRGRACRSSPGVTVVPLQDLVAENLESSFLVLLGAVGLCC
jgi:hypothetical protein